MIARDLKELLRSSGSAAFRLLGFILLCLLLGRNGERSDIPVFRASMMMPCALLLVSLALSLRGVRLLRRDLGTGFWDRFSPVSHVELRVFLALKTALGLIFIVCCAVFAFLRLCLRQWEGEGELIRTGLALLSCGSIVSLGLLTGVAGRKDKSILIHFLMLNALLWLSTCLIDETLWAEGLLRFLQWLPFSHMVRLMQQTQWDDATVLSAAVLGVYDCAFTLGAYLRFRRVFFHQ